MMASETVKSDCPIFLSSTLIRGKCSFSRLGLSSHTRPESWIIKYTLSCIFQSHVTSALVSPVLRSDIYIKTGIRIVMIRPISNLPELPRSVIFGHIALESISLGRKRLTFRPKADKHTPALYLITTVVLLQLIMNQMNLLIHVIIIISYVSSNLKAIRGFVFQKKLSSHTWSVLYSAKCIDVPYVLFEANMFLRTILMNQQTITALSFATVNRRLFVSVSLCLHVQ